MRKFGLLSNSRYNFFCSGVTPSAVLEFESILVETGDNAFVFRVCNMNGEQK